MKKKYITTAIAYPNGKPHMGHALEIIIADVLVRGYRFIGYDVQFQTGTDEHGIKNRRTAQENGQNIIDFLDANVDSFIELYTKLNISYDKFIRTSNKDNHHIGAKNLWNKMFEKGDIYKKSYKGFYCVGCESFKTEKDLENGICPNHPNGNIEEIEEENYFFKLSKYKNQVIDLIETDEYKIVPIIRKNEMISFLNDAKDVSFSRPKSSLPWGITVPNDENHVMYVWCDALSNYLTGQGFGLNDERKKTRPADLHIVGKDIQRFHAVFWPAMLISADIELPKELLAHGFLTLNGAKMGKSTGNVIDPILPIEKYGRDAVVFNLMYDVDMTSDGDFSMDRLDGIYNSMLIGARGNLVNRVVKLSQKYGIKIGKKTRNIDFFEDLNIDSFQSALDNYDIKGFLGKRYRAVQKANEFITIQEPWKKYKDSDTKDDAIADLEFLLYVVKNLAILSAPILVDGFDKIKNILGNNEIQSIITEKTGNLENLKNIFDSENFDVSLNPEIIYPRVEV